MSRTVVQEPRTGANRVFTDITDGVAQIGAAVIVDASGVVIQSAECSENSTETPLAGGASWTGTWSSTAGISTILVRALADVAGTLTVQWSDDGSTVWQTFLAEGDLSAPARFYQFTPTGNYFRLVVQNGADAQSSMIVWTRCCPGQVFLTSRLASNVSDYTPTFNVRDLSDQLLAEARGEHLDRLVDRKFGFRELAAGTSQTIWPGPTAGYTGRLTSADTIRIKAGGDAADTAAGAGAQSVVVVYLDADWAIQSVTLTTAGASASSASAGTAIRILRAYVEDAGASEVNVGAITIETSGGTVVAVIEASRGQTRQAHTSIPAGYTGYLRTIDVSADGTKATNFRLMRKPFGKSIRVMSTKAGVSGPFYQKLESLVEIDPKTDVWWEATGPSGGASASAGFDIILVRDY